MPTTLGFDSDALTNNPIDREFRASMAQGLQALGKQVQEGMVRIATNRQTKQMAEEFQQLDPQSPFFPQEMVGVITRYPLGAKSPGGVAGINLLGSAHKQWLTQQQKLATEKPYIFRDPKGRGMFGVNPRTGEEVFSFENPFPEAEPAPSFSADPNRPGSFFNRRDPSQIVTPDAPVTKPQGPPASKMFPDGTMREWSPEKNAWTVIATKPQPKGLAALRKNFGPKFVSDYIDAKNTYQTAEAKALKDEAEYNANKDKTFGDISGNKGKTASLSRAAAEKAKQQLLQFEELMSMPEAGSDTEETDVSLFGGMPAAAPSPAPAARVRKFNPATGRIE